MGKCPKCIDYEKIYILNSIRAEEKEKQNNKGRRRTKHMGWACDW